VEWNFSTVNLCPSVHPQFSPIYESPGQKKLGKQDAVFIVKNTRLGRIDGWEGSQHPHSDAHSLTGQTQLILYFDPIYRLNHR
jgi:hypothetical protein